MLFRSQIVILRTETRYKMFAFRTEDHNLPLINGCGQWIEHEYHADGFAVNDRGNAVSMELKEAYANKDEIESFARTATLADGKVIISDKIKLVSPGNAEFFITVFNMPIKVGENLYRIAENAVIRFPDGFDVTVETVVFEDTTFMNDWGVREIYKFRIKSAEKLESIDFTAEISRI